MKRERFGSKSGKSSVLLAAAVFAVMGGTARAALFWDADGNATGNNPTPPGFGGMGGNGTWNTSNINWWDGSSSTDTTWSDGNQAVFTGTTATAVTLSNSFAVSQIDFASSLSAYTLTGGTLTVSSGGIHLDNSTTTQVINSVLAGGDINYVKDNVSTSVSQLSLGGNNIFTGNINISATSTIVSGQSARLNLTSAGALPVGKGINFLTSNGQLVGTTLTTAAIPISGTVNLNPNAGTNEEFMGSNSGVTLSISGLVTGSSNLTFGSTPGQTPGAGVVVLSNAGNNWTGTTTLNMGLASGGASATKGWLVSGVDNALPTATAFVIGVASGNFGGLYDLAGHNQTVASLATGAGNTGAQGICNSGSLGSTFTIAGSASTTFAAPIGTTSSLKNPTPVGADLKNIRLVLSSANTGSLTLTSTGNDYTGGTQIDKGTLLVTNNGTGLGAGSGPITVGTTGGSPTSGTFGGAGSITSGLVTVHNGKLLPGGAGGIGTMTLSGGLSLNDTGGSGVSMAYDFNTAATDRIAVSAGSFSLPTTGSVPFTIDYGGTVPANGTYPLISYPGGGTLSAAQFATLSKTVINTGGPGTFVLANDPGAVDLTVSGAVPALTWRGQTSVPAGSGNWDTTTAANWLPATAYANGDIVTFDDTANGSGNLTVTISNSNSPVQPYSTRVVNTSKNYILDGVGANDVIGGTGDLVKSGTGSLTINKVQSYTGNTTINAGTVAIASSGGLGNTNVAINSSATVAVAAGGTLGSGNVTLGSSGTLSVSAASALASNASVKLAGGNLQFAASHSTGINPVVSVSSTLDTDVNNVTFTGAISSANNPGNVQVTKVGTGSLTLATPAPSYYGGWAINAGTVILSAASSGLTGLGPGSSTNFSTNSVNVNAGGTLKLANVQWGNYKDQLSAPEMFMGDQSTLAISGASSYGRASFAYQVNRPTGTLSVSTAITTSLATDTFDINSSVRQGSSATTAANSTIHVSGPGTVILHDGGVSSASVYSGNWSVDGGILQVGPVIANTPSMSGYMGPFGEPLNALGFVNGDPDSPTLVTVNTGATLALATDAHNTNPNITFPPLNTTPDYLRNSIMLTGGGALAATGQEVSYDTDPNGPQGAPTGTPVIARFGGDFTVSGSGTILTYNPRTTTEARTVELVGGTRNIVNASPNHLAGSTISYATNWAGTLTIDPGTTSGGAFDINRTGGTVSVTLGSQITINQGATVNLDGMNVLSAGANAVNILNNSTTSLHVRTGSHTMGDLSGSGNTTVDASATLTANKITQNKLTLNGRANVTKRVANVNKPVYLKSLSVNGAGTLDLNDNDLVVEYSTNVSPFANIQGLVFNGYSGTVDPSKTGIISSTGQTDGHTILALIDNALVGATDWPIGSGHTIAGNSVIGKYTYFGDMDLSGDVTPDDYGILDANLGTTPDPRIAWISGDADLSGDVTPDDYGILDANIGRGVGNPLSPAGVSGTSAVPEPASLGLIGLGAGMLLRRRRSAK